MRTISLVSLALLFTAMGLCGTPPYLATWNVPGMPIVGGLVSTSNYNKQTEVWFTERDSFKVGDFVFPKSLVCANSDAREYNVFPVKPYKITYAEKAFTVRVKQTRGVYALQPWFIDYTQSPIAIGQPALGMDSIYGLSKKTGLVKYPTSGGAIAKNYPLGIQWAAKTTIDRNKIPAMLWFNGYQPSFDTVHPTMNLYSLEPIANNPSTPDANLTQYTFPDGASIIAFRIESGFVWCVCQDQSAQPILYMMPVNGGQGLRWRLNGFDADNGKFGATVQPIYSKAPKDGQFPDKICVNMIDTAVFITFQKTLSPAGIDTACTYVPPGGSLMCGTYANNKRPPIMNRLVAAHFYPLGDSMSFMYTSASTVIHREAVTFTTTRAVVHGATRPAPVSSKTLLAVCDSVKGSVGTTQCVHNKVDISYPHHFISPQEAPDRIYTIDIAGINAMNGVDLVFNTVGGPASGGMTFNSSICRMTWKTPSSLAAKKTLYGGFSMGVGRHRLPTVQNVDDAYPNPFNPTTTIRFTLSAASRTTLVVYNALGQEVARLLDGEQLEEGDHDITFDGSNLASGVYYYRLEANGSVAIRKLMLMK